VLHLLVYMPIQLYLGIKIERTIGWLRFCIIYLLSGVGGNIVSCVGVCVGHYICELDFYFPPVLS